MKKERDSGVEEEWAVFKDAILRLESKYVKKERWDWGEEGGVDRVRK